ncbi:unnamed protein product [Microthlaspi erraticum]|uniref:Transmembrane protein n=1 Tax=Microthlaspi erraticum TaxID=1685480 RepID=A0A6D2K595_9BRAS|nr:unnamed protein product [Microthlaspi erraticum]
MTKMKKVEMGTATTSAIRAPNWRKAVLFWTISLTIFYSLFQMGLRNSPSTSSSSSSSSSDHFVNYAEQSTRLYNKMELDLEIKGPVFLKQGETSQSLSLSDLFTIKNGNISPVLKVANPPVRANVLHLSTEYSVPVSKAVKNVFGPYFQNTIWFQDSKLYHFSMFHASHHIVSVPATEDEVEAEAAGVNAVANELCPLEIVLDRVLLTSTGVLLGCWKVKSGDDPITIRSKLRSVLPRAPEKQLYDAAILHTSLARLLGPPISPKEEAGSDDHLKLLRELVAKLNNQIRGFKAIVSELWYVEEFDLLALALGGRMKIRSFKLGCGKS